MTEKTNVEEVVLQVLGKFLGKKKIEMVTPSSRLVGDLKIDSDDLSMYFVPEIECRLGVHVPMLAWRDVYTVEDACALIRKHLASLNG